MQCTRVTASREQLLDPLTPEWSRIAAEPLKMAATPLANQPSEYIKASRDEKQIGKVRSLDVQAAHNGSDIFFRLTWEDATQDVQITDTTMFTDGCGILIPLHATAVGGADPPIDEMGSKDAPVNAWFWRADFKDVPRNTIAHGLGSTQFTERCAVRTKSAWGAGTWTVVFTRPLAVPDQQEETVQLAAGASVKIGFAVWEGSNGERAGVKSFSKEWRELVLDA